MLCFEPTTCALALSALEAVLLSTRGPPQACPRARLWLRRVARRRLTEADVQDALLDATIGETLDNGLAILAVLTLAAALLYTCAALGPLLFYWTKKRRVPTRQAAAAAHRRGSRTVTRVWSDLF